MHPATTPSPPAQTMVVLTAIPHQSSWEQVAWSATGIKACCSLSAMGPPAETGRQSLLPSSICRTLAICQICFSVYPPAPPIIINYRVNSPNLKKPHACKLLPSITVLFGLFVFFFFQFYFLVKQTLRMPKFEK